jgi:hypothetical protein
MTMPTETEIQAERDRLYESAVLREELNDDEATILLEWGEKQVIRLAKGVADGAELEQQARFLRQLLKNMNRFVGQRQYNNRDEQMEYLEKVVQWLAKLGFKEHATPDLLDKLPSDAKDMAGTLRALISAIDPGNASPTTDTPPTPQGRLGALQEAVSAQNVPAEETPRQRGGDLSQGQPHERDAAHNPQTSTHNSANQAVKSIMDHMKDASKESDAPPESLMRQAASDHVASPTSDHAVKSIMDHMKDASKEPEKPTDSSMRQMVSDHLKSPPSDTATQPLPPPKENDALAALRHISKPTDQQPPDDGPHFSKSSSEDDSGQSKSIRDLFKSRDKDKDDGKTTE